MKQIILIIMALLSLIILSGCMGKTEIVPIAQITDEATATSEPLQEHEICPENEIFTFRLEPDEFYIIIGI